MLDIREHSLNHPAKTCSLFLRSLCSSNLTFFEDTWSFNEALLFNHGCRKVPFENGRTHFLSHQSLFSSLLNDWLSKFLSHCLFVLLMYYGSMQFMNDIFVLFMDHWLMDLVDNFLVYDWLHFLMNHLLMMLMYNLLMMLDDNRFMMLMDNISMMFLDYRLLHLSLNSGFLCVLNNFRLLFIGFDLDFLLLSDYFRLLK